MVHLLAFLAAMVATAGFAAIASLLVFRDPLEGFRILYHLIDNTGSHSLPRDIPRESRRGIAAQLLFAIICIAVASIGYLALVPVVARFLAK